MDTSKIIKGVVSNGRYTVTAPIVKEDYGLYLQIEGIELPSTYEVDFSNSESSGTSVTMIGNADGVLIPHQFIDTGKDIFAFLYHVGADFGRTVYKFRIPNKVRPDRTNEEPTPEEQSVIDQCISALNEAVAQIAGDVESADQSAQSAESAKTAAESARDTAGEYANDAESSAASASTSASQASNSATASAQSASQSAQIKADVEDLADDAQASANASAQSANASANSASQAQGFANNASASAQSASQSASGASASAQTASAKAQDASGYAQTASGKASESAQSASQALSYKTDAESAKTASQTAQGLAESARDSAISAKTDAEQAKADAESARDEAVQAVASISGALDDKADVITDTASGAVASFTDGADGLPLKSLVVNIDPVQDLHGYYSPWVAGGGVNKLPPMVDGTYTGNGLTAVVKNGIVTLSGTSTASGNALIIPLTEEYTVTQGYLHLCNSVANASFAPSLESENISATSVAFACSPVNRIGAIPSDKIGQTWTRVRVWISNGVTVSGTFAPMVCEDNTVRQYAPYENICPISGWTGCEVNATGKNLLDPTLMKDQMAWNTIRIYAPVGTTLTMSTNSPNASTADGLPCYFKRSGEGNGSSTIVNASHPTTKIVPNEGYVEINQRNPSNTVSFNDFQWQIEVGTTETDYEPYTGRTIPISWQTEAGTVYGGKLDVLRGVLRVDRLGLDGGDLSWTKVDNYNYGNFFINTSPFGKYSATTPTVLSSAYKSESNTSASATADCYTWMRSVTYNIRRIYVKDTSKASMAAEEFRTAMTGVQFIYELAEPIEIQLDAHTLNSLYGQNNIFADTGDTTCEYRADPDLYIQRKMPEVPVDDVQINGTSIVEDGVANVPIANNNNLGVIMLGSGLGINGTTGSISVSAATNDTIKTGTDRYIYIDARRAYAASFYGLAKAAGDATQSQSSNAIGVYTEDAKSKISEMLGGSVSVSGTSPTIVAKAGIRYVCGEVATLDFTPSATGICDVVFTSGSTPTVVTLPSTVKFPDGAFTAEADTTYEINILDGIYGAVMSWT